MRPSIFEYSNYKEYLQDLIKSFPKNGWGIISQWATETRIAQAQLSQTIVGERELSQEQGYSLSQVIKHTSIEAKYFQLLIQKNRAGTNSFKKFIENQMDELQSTRLKIGDRIDDAIELSEVTCSIYFSNWIYTAIRQFCFIEDGKTIEQIQDRFNLPPDLLDTIIHFLVDSKICFLSENKKIVPSASVIKLGKSAPVLYTHHSHWRLKALESFSKLTESELMLTIPMSLSREQFEKFREQIVQLTMNHVTDLQKKNAEEIACLNLDLFYVR